MKTEHPMLFKPEMVLAILDGRKTQTRRLNGLGRLNADPGAWKSVRPLTESESRRMKAGPNSWIAFRRDSGTGVVIQCPYGTAGHMIWGRENFRYGGWTKDSVCINYQADDSAINLKAPPGVVDKLREKSRAWVEGLRGGVKAPDPLRPLPCLFLPRFASRLNLKIKDIQAERLQDITPADARREGCPEMSGKALYYDYGEKCYVMWFGSLWNSINGHPLSWAYNPWVWKINFIRMKKGKNHDE